MHVRSSFESFYSLCKSLNLYDERNCMRFEFWSFSNNFLVFIKIQEPLRAFCEVNKLPLAADLLLFVIRQHVIQSFLISTTLRSEVSLFERVLYSRACSVCHFIMHVMFSSTYQRICSFECRFVVETHISHKVRGQANKADDSTLESYTWLKIILILISILSEQQLLLLVM